MFVDVDGITFNDETGTNFGANTPDKIAQNLPYEQGAVYAWSLDDFTIPYGSWTPGATVSIASGAAPDVVIIKAPTSPYLSKNIDMTATGTVTGPTGTAVTFDKSTVTTEEYWELEDSEGHKQWFAKITDGSNSFLVTSQNFAETGTSFKLTNVDLSPGERTASTTDFESFWDTASGVANVTEANLNSAYFPRIDVADSPLSPAHLGDKEDGSDTSWENNFEGEYAVYQSSAIEFIYDPVAKTYTPNIKADGSPYLGKFYTKDNDEYFHDGTGTYDSEVNDLDQIGRAEGFADGTVISPQLFQAENSFAVSFTNKAGELVTAQIARISFGGTYSTQYVWLVSKNFEFGASDYKYLYSDGSPGFDNGYPIDEEMAFQYSDLLVCFVAGTGIQTIDGIVSVEDLRAGDFVLTKDNGYQPVRWVGSSKIEAERLQSDPKLLPIRISASALSENIPSEDLYVSRQHRILVGSKIVKRMFDQDEVLIKAKDLVDIIPRVECVELAGDLSGEVEYYHVLFDQHEVIYANGAPAESLYLGDTAMMALDEEAQTEIRKIFPELSTPAFQYTLAREVVTSARARTCMKRHVNAGTELLN